MRKINNDMQYKSLPDATPTQAGDSRTFRFCFSDDTVDRAGDKIDPKGWILDDFLTNPVALWSHDVTAPIGRASNVKVENGRLMGDIEFAPPDVSELADEIFRLVKAGYVKAVSVGFQALDYEYSKDKDRPQGVDYLEQNLCEISLCSVPMNPSCLIEAQAKGMTTPVLDAWFATTEADSSKSVNTPNADHPTDEELLMSLRSVLKQTEQELARLRRKGEGDDVVDMDMGDENDPTDSHELSLHMALVHSKAMAYHHKECMKCLQKAIDDIGDEHPDEKDDDGDDDGDGDDDAEKPQEKAIRARELARIRARVAKV